MIILYGVLDKARSRFERLFGDRVLVWPREHLLRSLADVEAVVLATKFLGHREQARAVCCYGRNRVWRVWGGETRLAIAISELLKRRASV